MRFCIMPIFKNSKARGGRRFARAPHRVAEEIGLLVLDASFAELQADLAAQDQAEQSTFVRLLRDGEPKLIVGNYTFGQTADGLCTLGKLAEIAAGLSAPFVATGCAAARRLRFVRGASGSDNWKQKLPADVSRFGIRSGNHRTRSRRAGRAAIHPAAAPWQSG